LLLYFFLFLNKAGSVVLVNAFEKNVQIVVYIRRNWMAMSSTLSIICALESSVQNLPYLEIKKNKATTKTNS
jgi:hypothetical protein